MRYSAFLFLLVLSISAFGDTIDLGRGDVEVLVPKNYSVNRPIPLVMLLHGYTSSGAAQDAYFKLSTLVDEYGFIFVAPDGTVEEEGGKNRFWNAGEKNCCNFQGSTVNDSAYLKTLIEAVQNRYSIDSKQIFVTGHSNGGFMSHRLAYDYPETIAAIVALNGAAPLSWTKARPSSPVNILHIHGTADTVNLYHGNQIFGVPYPGAETGIRNWAYYAFGNAIPLEQTTRRDLDEEIKGNETVVKSWADGRIELWTIEGGPHVPPFVDDFNRQIIDWMYAHPKP